MLNDPGLPKAMETAKQAVQSMYPEEELTDIEIEEVEQELMGDWIITVGFNRPKTRRTLGGLTIPMRSLKRVVIEHGGGSAKSIKMYKSDG